MQFNDQFPGSAIDLVETGLCAVACVAICKQLRLARVERVDIDVIGLLSSAGVVVQDNDGFLCCVSGHVGELYGAQREASGGILSASQPDLAFLGYVQPPQMIVAKFRPTQGVGEVLEVDLSDGLLAVGKSSRDEEQHCDCESPHERSLVGNRGLFNRRIWKWAGGE
jgi:hypothetical protein